MTDKELIETLQAENAQLRSMLAPRWKAHREEARCGRCDRPFFANSASSQRETLVLLLNLKGGKQYRRGMAQLAVSLGIIDQSDWCAINEAIRNSEEIK